MVDLEFGGTTGAGRYSRAPGREHGGDRRLGHFPSGRGAVFPFRAGRFPRVFIAYVEEDRPAAGRLYDTLEGAGFAPWLDKRKLLPGQNWPRAIEAAIEASDFFVGCFSPELGRQEGRVSGGDPVCTGLCAATAAGRDFHRPGAVRAVPPAAGDCTGVPYVDLLPDWGRGTRRLVAMMRRELDHRRATR